ncbi:hypothetical protein SAMN05428974_0524 [Sphingopyxis sp. YR583]|uniref:hypothetical protein n=1 Tax=Sphingopyxis sp. YR583 TaxID=1881047 RepID=UPI0008A74E38|nr:hypothetical protein [Sphingopyxis sp. YR583]SEH12635.1 hypothetical protein SAMN05428974_0524 [Sphingopyxis sp. YR583]
MVVHARLGLCSEFHRSIAWCGLSLDSDAVRKPGERGEYVPEAEGIAIASAFAPKFSR